MKVSTSVLFSSFILFQITLNLSCVKNQDPCEDALCQNGGTCLEGVCHCPDGFVGEFCEFTSGTFTDARDNRSYRWVILKDGKKWMADNLNYWEDGLPGSSYYYDNMLIESTDYGRLYVSPHCIPSCNFLQ